MVVTLMKMWMMRTQNWNKYKFLSQKSFYNIYVHMEIFWGFIL